MSRSLRRGIPLEEWAQEDPTEREGWEDDEPVLDQHGKPILKEPRKYGASFRGGLGAAAGTLVVRGEGRFSITRMSISLKKWGASFGGGGRRGCIASVLCFS